jgi:hypothetical protein
MSITRKSFGRMGLVMAGSALLFAASAASADDALDRLRVTHVERTVKAVRLDPHGRPSGVILSDGMEYVGVANQNLLQVASPGDPVRVELGAGDRLVLVNERTLRGATIGPRAEVDLQPFVPYATSSPPTAIGGGPKDTTFSDETFSDKVQNLGEGIAPKRLDDAIDLGRYAVVGRVDTVLKTPTGAPAGLLMTDGTQVHVIPRVADVLARFHEGDELRIEGRGTRTGLGTSMWATAITQGRLVHLDLERGNGAPEIGVAGNGPQ